MKLVALDDEADIVELIADVGLGLGWTSVATSDPATFERVVVEGADVAFIDLMMPGTDGVEMLRRLAASGCRSGIVLTSGLDRRVLQVAEDLARSLGLRTLGRLEKPFRIPQIEELLRLAATPRPMRSSSQSPREYLSLEEIERALNENLVVPFFQIQMDMATSSPGGCETLVRIVDPRRGILPPDSFIPVAEGIETKEQERLLKEMGCDLGQGYLYSKPVPMTEIPFRVQFG